MAEETPRERAIRRVENLDKGLSAENRARNQVKREQGSRDNAARRKVDALRKSIKAYSDKQADANRAIAEKKASQKNLDGTPKIPGVTKPTGMTTAQMNEMSKNKGKDRPLLQNRGGVVGKAEATAKKVMQSKVVNPGARGKGGSSGAAGSWLQWSGAKRGNN